MRGEGGRGARDFIACSPSFLFLCAGIMCMWIAGMSGEDAMKQIKDEMPEANAIILHKVSRSKHTNVVIRLPQLVLEKSNTKCLTLFKSKQYSISFV